MTTKFVFPEKEQVTKNFESLEVGTFIQNSGPNAAIYLKVSKTEAVVIRYSPSCGKQIGERFVANPQWCVFNIITRLEVHYD